MTVVMVFQFFVLLGLLTAAAVGGFLIARWRYKRQYAQQIALLSNEAAKVRRRLNAAEDRSRSAENELSRKRRKTRNA